jgi:uncharacterized BrkB/YihY/UPF0761 family membrane protein
MNKIKASFWKLTLRFSIVFFVLFAIFRTIFKILKDGFSQMKTDYFSQDTWHLFLIQLAIGSLCYGLFMAGYYKFIKK